MKVLVPAAAATLLLAACPSNCKQACENVNKICAAQYEAEGVKFDVDACTGVCESNLDGCKNMPEQESCVATRETCSALQTCPGCTQ
ncbi:MAG TPA: hypothetical protein VGK67_21650 [Myxococcales bacterium]|jgi:hypothetical protein